MSSMARFQRVKQASIIVIALIALPTLAHLIGSGEIAPATLDQDPDQDKRVARSCNNLRLEQKRLSEMAKRCETDADCFHYRGSCFALAEGPHATTLISIDEALARGCGDSIELSDCGETTPACVAKACAVRPADSAG